MVLFSELLSHAILIDKSLFTVLVIHFEFQIKVLIYLDEGVP